MAARVARIVRLYFRLQFLQLRAHLEYEADFWIGIVGMALTQAAGLVFIWAVFQRIPQVGGWSLWEIALLYALVTISRGLVEIFCDGPWELRRMVNQGEFDRILVRPLSPALQVITQLASIHGIGEVLLGLAITARAVAELRLVWMPWQYGFLLITLLSGVVLMGSINYVTNCIAFWEPAATGAFPYLVYNLAEFARYPLTLYGRLVQLVTTWVLPLAFVSYYPGAILLSKPIPQAWLGYLAPVAAAGAALIAALVWRAGLTRYQSTGH